MAGLINWLERIAFGFIVVALTFFGFYSGAEFQSFVLDIFFVVIEISFLDAISSSFGFALFFFLSSIIYFYRLLNQDNHFVYEAGSLTCIVPVYKDEDVMGKSITSLLQSNYEDLEILIVCEPGDEDAISKAKEFSQIDCVEYVINEANTGTKAGALNTGIDRCETDFLAFFDSNQIVDQDFIPLAVKKLTDGLDVFQGRNRLKPVGLVGSLAYYQNLFFRVPRQLTRFVTSFRLTLTKSTVFKAEALEKVGRFDEDTLTEDLDYAFRCYKSDIAVGNSLRLGTREKPPAKFIDWWCQRKRWMTGYFGVFWKNLKSLKVNKNISSFLSTIICAASLSGSFFMLMLVSKFILLILIGAGAIYLVPVVLVMATAVLGRFYDFISGGESFPSFYWAFSPLVFPMFSLVTIRSFIAFLSPDSSKWYKVER
jgi:cellulose synthase/poly-beta-1,6-N-acetylglucosamine synthase-like glycosyltransferase